MAEVAEKLAQAELVALVEAELVDVLLQRPVKEDAQRLIQVVVAVEVII